MKELSLAGMRTVYILGAGFFLAAFLSTLIDFSYMVRLKRDVGFMVFITIASICVGIAIGMISIYTRRWMKESIFFWTLLMLALGLRLIWVFSIPTPISSDFAEMYEAAKLAVRGDYSFSGNPYFSTWVYQIGFTMYEGLIMKLFGEQSFALKLLNVLYSTGTVMLVYGIARKYKESAGRMAGILYAVYPPTIMMCSVLTNEHIATFLIYLALYLLIVRGVMRPRTWLYVGVLLAVGDVMRPIGSIVLISIGCYILLLLGKNVRNYLEIIGRFAGIVVIFFFVHAIISYSLIYAGVTKYPLSSREPLWKFVVGLNAQTNGQYSAEDEKYVTQFPVGAERTAIERKLIEERLADHSQVARLFVEKFKLMWGGNDASIYWSLDGLDHPRLKDWLFKCERVLYSSILLFASIGCMTLLSRRKLDAVIVLLILVLGYAAIHLFIEIQTRYRSFLFPSFAIFFSYGLSYVYEKVPFRLQRR